MPSVTELRKRIEELSSTIELRRVSNEEHQTQVLRGLEITRSDVRCDLNAMCDPVARLPVEISSTIFVCCLPTDTDYPRPNCYDAPMLIRNVCRLWNDVALATPALWVGLRFDFRLSLERPSDAPSTNHLGVWLDRSGNHPLRLSLGGIIPCSMYALIKAHAHQVQALELRLSSSAWEAFGRESISFSALQKLTLYPRTTNNTNLSHCIEILRRAPLLVECEFVYVYCRDGDLPISQPLIHTCLQHLRLRGATDRSCPENILRHITLPALETLHITDFNIPSADFTSFLARSAPPLRSLSITANYDDLGADLRLVPSLTQLTLKCWGSYNYSIDILGSLAASQDSLLLPDLCDLTILGRFSDYYDTLLRVLQNRCRPLASLRIVLPSMTVDDKPPDHILAALRQFAENGVRIHVGTEDNNFIQ
ncbi:hypothetical protein DFH08DRAFT_930590 [Mycena albidolilacea]|uniref:F-box domain-containing protein n=1 Tax=Mycena albidolilacea TaxID=1033008 RepID=A0AAD7AR26_9AGAR|nr:hypothetical protein DFH08DRAFT_930590 [Mycena albidolilacea]